MSTHGQPGYVLALSGRLDASTAPELDRQLVELPDGASKTVTIDLSDVTYVASSGLRTLLLAHRRQQTGGGRLVVRHPQPRVWAVMQLCGFDQILDVCPSETPDAI